MSNVQSLLQPESAVRRLWIPYVYTPEGEQLLCELEPRSPYPIEADVPQQGCPLLVLVDGSLKLTAARDLAQSHNVVLWVWRCPENIALRAEASFPVVYGVPTVEDVEIASGCVPAQNRTTSLLMQAEQEFNIPSELA